MKTDEKSLVVRQANQLIEASYKMPSVGEGRLIRMLIAQISPKDEDFKTYRIAVADFAKFFGLTGGSAYDLIKKAADELTSRKLKFEHGKSWLYINWLSSAEYLEGRGYVELRFDGKMKPFLLQLQTHWKHYALENIINFRSAYSIRIFELLKVEEFKADSKGYFKRSFEYEDLRRILGIDKKEYPLFADIRRYVIETATREINANPDIKITKVDYQKTGRKISHIAFHCEKAKQLQLDIDEPFPKFEAVEATKEHPDYITELMAIGIEESTAYKWKRKYSVARLREAIAYTKAMQRAGKIRDSLTGFLARAVMDNIGSSWVGEQRKQEAERAKREEAEQVKQKSEDIKLAQERKEREKVFSRFEGLPESEKIKIRTSFEEQLKPSSRGLWNRAKERSPNNPEKESTVKTSFIIFFKSLQHD